MRSVCRCSCKVGLLLGLRTLKHPKLRLEDNWICFDIQVGGRLGYNIRCTLQYQPKSCVDSQHNTHDMLLVLIQTTAKHWALASQTISLLDALIGLFFVVSSGACISYCCNVSSALRDYRIHRDEIHAKLVAVMKDCLLTLHLPTLSQLVET
uniref:Vacuolar protein sorting-associated protein 54 C-terminal domain-containing protein n=1 Tax=Physcomitrium patens TaxID=3218 RepID=A0A2K1KAG7_PHYPA|nr:hypothetical protein PHYPA_009945 [Physcomitrium patens]